MSGLSIPIPAQPFLIPSRYQTRFASTSGNEGVLGVLGAGATIYLKLRYFFCMAWANGNGLLAVLFKYVLYK